MICLTFSEDEKCFSFSSSMHNLVSLYSYISTNNFDSKVGLD